MGFGRMVPFRSSYATNGKGPCRAVFAGVTSKEVNRSHVIRVIPEGRRDIRPTRCIWKYCRIDRGALSVINNRNKFDVHRKAPISVASERQAHAVRLRLRQGVGRRGHALLPRKACHIVRHGSVTVVCIRFRIWSARFNVNGGVWHSPLSPIVRASKNSTFDSTIDSGVRRVGDRRVNHRRGGVAISGCDNGILVRFAV
jgi:hypothetical protein